MQISLLLGIAALPPLAGATAGTQVTNHPRAALLVGFTTMVS